MKDTIIKNTGNSRFLRSSVAEDITFAEFIALLRAGQLPIDLAGINDEGIETLGMALAKENLLDDETEVAIWGNAGDRTPTAALKAIATNFSAALEGKVVTGTYTGNGVASRTISLGLRPKAVILRGVLLNQVIGQWPTGSTFTSAYGTLIATENSPAGGGNGNSVEITANGFVVRNASASDGFSATKTNTNNAVYNYIAIA